MLYAITTRLLGLASKMQAGFFEANLGNRVIMAGIQQLRCQLIRLTDLIFSLVLYRHKTSFLTPGSLLNRRFQYSSLAASFHIPELQYVEKQRSRLPLHKKYTHMVCNHSMARQSGSSDGRRM